MKMFITLHNNIHMENLSSKYDYYGCVDGKVTSITPENGDIIFDNLAELERYKKAHKKTKKNTKKK